jgi:predicted PurR-regulated permease PerM
VNVTLSPRERTAIRIALFTLPVITTIAAAFLLGYIANVFFSILVMFFLAWLLAFLLDPIVTRMVARLPFLPRGAAAALVFVASVVIAIIFLAIVASTAITSLTQVIGNAPTIDDAIARLVRPLQEQIDQFNLSIDLTKAAHDVVQSVKANTSTFLSAALNSGLTLFTQGTSIIFIAVVFVASKEQFLAFLRRLVPDDRTELFDEFTSATAHSFGGFVRGQFGTAALYGLFSAIIAIVFNVPFPMLIGLVTLGLQSIPYFGQLVSWIPLILTTVIFVPSQLLPVTVIFVVILLVMQQVVTPRVMASAVGINPVLVLAAVFIGAQLAGIFGAIFGVPVLAVIVSLVETYLDRVRPPDVYAETTETAGSLEPAGVPINPVEPEAAPSPAISEAR